MRWNPVSDAPEMRAVFCFHEYYSHGRVRHAYQRHDGEWIGVNASGTETALGFKPTHWTDIPPPPESEAA